MCSTEPVNHDKVSSALLIWKKKELTTQNLAYFITNSDIGHVNHESDVEATPYRDTSPVNLPLLIIGNLCVIATARTGYCTLYCTLTK